MNIDTRYETFTRTRSTWSVLTIAALMWVGLCVWAVRSIGFVGDSLPPADESTASVGSTQTEAEARVAALDLLALEAEEDEKLQAQAAAAEQRRIEADRVEEQVRLAAEQDAAERARLAAAAQARQQTLLAEEQARAERERLAAVAAAEELAAEQARLAEEAEQARLAAEKAAEEEQARLAAEKAAEEEQARLAAEKAAEDERARLAAEKAAEEEQARLVAEKAAEEEQARLAAEQKAEEQDRLAAIEAETAIGDSARQAAAAEASRVAAVARQLRQYESLRERELQVLEGLSNRIRFERGSATVSRDIERLLDDIFNPLYLYSDLPVLVSVAGNEYSGTTSDDLLSRDRGRAIASYLINRGLEKDRFRILIESGVNLASGTHRVRVSAEEVRQ